jgi:hypothetical protein
LKNRAPYKELGGGFLTEKKKSKKSRGVNETVKRPGCGGNAFANFIYN